ncbi:uncharacterized protein LOC141659811 [Apium graveolens]|uniref:uncharacterized protein LOC141659811 n=1 Tax=Apium graveolens TaxID=4045 RepID=UPI003D79218C
MAAAASEVAWLVRLLDDIGITNLQPITLFCDNYYYVINNGVHNKSEASCVKSRLITYCILNIPLKADVNVDKLYWIGEMTSLYSVRSAYKMIQSQKGFWNDFASSGVWSKLWKIKVPSKVLHVCWRALAGCLPTMTQLFCRRVPMRKVCPVCGEEEETIIHALVFCPVAATCWHKLHFAAGSLVTDDFNEWFSHMLNRYSKERNSEGVMVYARTCRYWGRVAPEFDETMAVKEALSWSKTEGMKVIIESNCLTVVQAIRSKVPMISSLGLLVEECRQLLGMQNNVELFFIKRSANIWSANIWPPTVWLGLHILFQIEPSIGVMFLVRLLSVL